MDGDDRLKDTKIQRDTVPNFRPLDFSFKRPK